MTGEVVAGTGMWIGIIANLAFLTHLVPSDFLKALILMVGLFVSLLISPKAGELIDRFDKKKILFYATLIRCLAPTSMFFAIAYDSISWMVVSTIFIQMAATFYIPSAQASIPSIVPQTELLRANSIYMNAVTLSRIGGTALGGLLVTMMDLMTLYMITLVSYVILAFLISPIQIPKIERKSKAQSEQVRFREVFGMVRSEPAIFIGLFNSMMLSFFVGGFNLLVINFSEHLHAPQLTGWIYTVEGTCVLLAGLMAKRWVGNKNLVAVSTLFVFVLGLAQFGMSVSMNVVSLLISFAVFGISFGFMVPMNSTIFQKQLPENARGRFFSFKNMLDRVWFQVSLLLTGAGLDFMGIGMYMFTLCVVTIIVGIVSLSYGRRHALDVRQVSEPKAKTA